MQEKKDESLRSLETMKKMLTSVVKESIQETIGRWNPTHVHFNDIHDNAHVYIGSESIDTKPQAMPERRANSLDGQRRPEVIRKYIRNNELIDEFLDIVTRFKDNCPLMAMQMDHYLIKTSDGEGYCRIPYKTLQEAAGVSFGFSSQNYGDVCKTYHILNKN